MFMQRLLSIISGIVAATTEAACSDIPFQHASGGMVLAISGEGLTTLTWYAFNTTTGTFLPLYGKTGSAITTTIAVGHAVPIPDECFGAAHLKAVANAAATLTIMTKG
jgi:hypothetical protein